MECFPWSRSVASPCCSLPWLMVLRPCTNLLFSAAIKTTQWKAQNCCSKVALCLKIWQVCAFSVFCWCFLRVIHYWMMLFPVEGIKICLCLSSGEFFPSCFSNWSRSICSFQVCVCSSLVLELIPTFIWWYSDITRPPLVCKVSWKGARTGEWGEQNPSIWRIWELNGLVFMGDFLCKSHSVEGLCSLVCSTVLQCYK